MRFGDRTQRWLIVAFILVFSLACDQWTKQLAQNHLKGRPTRSYCGDTMRLQYAENPGAFLGVGGQLSPSVRWGLLVVVNTLIATVICGAILFGWKMSTLHLIACALLLSGAIGNLIDRLQYDGMVVDFMNMGIGPMRTGIFNVADMAISAGAVVLIAGNLRTRPLSAPLTQSTAQ